MGVIELQSVEPHAKEFKITLGEAEVPQNGHALISNVLKGDVTFPDPAKEKVL